MSVRSADAHERSLNHLSASHACPPSKATSRSKRDSKTTGSATYTSKSRGADRRSKLYLFVAINRLSKFAFATLFPRAGMVIASAFIRDLIAAVPYTIHMVQTDNSIQFTNGLRSLCHPPHLRSRLR